jgi:hypothetical protein
MVAPIPEVKTHTLCLDKIQIMSPSKKKEVNTFWGISEQERNMSDKQTINWSFWDAEKWESLEDGKSKRSQ